MEKFPENLTGETETLQNRLGQPLASPAGKWKGFHHDRPNFLLDVVAQHGAGAMQSGFDGLRPELENCSRLLDIHSLDHAGDKNDAERLGKFIDRMFDDL